MFEEPTIYYIIGGVSIVVFLGWMTWTLHVIVKWLEDTFGRGDH